MSAEELIAQPKEVKDDDLTGAGVVESNVALIKDIFFDATSWDELAMEGLVAGLDLLSAWMNPLGELVKAGVGWLMEHLDLIREPLEVLTGDANQVNAIADTWTNIGKRLDDAAAEYKAAMPLTEDWRGDAATRYRELAMAYFGALGQVAEQARSAATGLKVAGVVVATERAIVFDLIATFVSDVITRALLALASSWFTFGTSVCVFVASVVTDAVQLAAKLQKRLGNLLGSIQRFVKKFDELGVNSARLQSALGRVSTTLGQEANQVIKGTTKTLGELAPQAGRLKDFSVRTERYAESTIGRALDGMPAKVGKEGMKATNDTVNPDD
ncbi:WXG100 family type VII secretion target [Actinokineospora enzanensis]|uniref:WXG100 family type VII secretion target n=1 Tax=Actinokineospora enzanensis TaxID=155975 RepID=UPI000373D4B8|nr:PPE domain-containing protein [Actinokineospora enzanensis]